MFKHFLYLLLLMLLCQDAYGETLTLETFESRDVAIRYETALKKAAPDVADTYIRAKVALEKKMHLELDLKPVIILIHTDSFFSRMVGGNKLVTAFAVPRDNHIYIDYSKMLKTPFDLELTLTHELCHLLLHNYIQSDNLPKWLDEGVSQWASGGIADILNFDGKKLLKEAVISGKYLSLNSLAFNFPAEQNKLILAYEESKSFVEYIEEEYGSDKILLILKSLHDGDDINMAISNNLPLSLSALELEWHRHLKKRYTWFYFFSDNLVWILFVFAAVLTVIGYLRLRVRMKTHFKDEEEDEDKNV
ncbi:MAG: peptidase MA family metallohydrolase [Nitrospirota bacterium]